jgi:hypothetical protein
MIARTRQHGGRAFGSRSRILGRPAHVHACERSPWEQNFNGSGCHVQLPFLIPSHSVKLIVFAVVACDCGHIEALIGTVVVSPGPIFRGPRTAATFLLTPSIYRNRSASHASL